MHKRLTEKIAVSVLPEFVNSDHIHGQRYFLFSYHIEIDNQSQMGITLLKRHWYIFDSKTHYSEVKGDGVLGKQPFIPAGESHHYQSFCRLESEMGMMWGQYLMKKENQELILVKIPEFELIAPHRLN